MGSIVCGIPLFFVSARFRMFLVPVSIVYGVYAVFTFIKLIKVKNLKMLFLFLLFMPLFFMSTVRNNILYKNNRKQEFYDYSQLGKEFLFKQECESAEAYVKKAITINNENPDSYFFIGYVLTGYTPL